jgi:hypothetical protein
MGVILQLWFVFAAFLASAGWLLSLFHALNAFGYSVALLLFFFIAVFWFKAECKRAFCRSFLIKLRRRFCKAAPLSYLFLAAIATLGGAIHYPTHFGAFSYGIPRILHWLDEEKWHWIRTADVRLNVVAPNFEWLATPLIAFTKTERLLFLINSFSFLLLPGALFCLFHRLGMQRRVAWWWMWIIPAGYCYCMQAGSVGTDGYVAVFSAGSVGLALRSRQTRSLRDLWASILGIAFVTGAKQSNIALALPWLIAVWPSLKLLIRRRILSAAIGLLALGASALPITLCNLFHGVHWSGFGKGFDGAPENAFWGIVGNSFWITFSNLLPPIFPWADKWNAGVKSFLATDLGSHFRSFESFGHTYRAAAELYSGVGVAVFSLLLISAIAGLSKRRNEMQLHSESRLVRLSAWLGFVVFMAKVGINQNVRYLAPYYPLLIPSFLLNARQMEIIRERWWRFLAFAAILSSAGLLIISRQRPLFPVKTLLTFLENRGRGNFYTKIANSYSFVEQLRYDLSPLLQKVPPSVNRLGYGVSLGDKEPYLWKPLWTRKVIRIAAGDTPQVIRSLGIRYLILEASFFSPPDGLMDQRRPSSKILSFDEWLVANAGESLGQLQFRSLPDSSPETLYLVRLKDE